MKSKIITILGQTAIGKSDLAVDISLFLKEKYNIDSEIISADSRQIYKHLNLGTGKITAKEMRGVKHHMLDIIDPNDTYSVYQYTEEVNKIIDGLLSRNIMPIICGGTGQYIDGVLFNIKGAGAKQDPELRDGLEKENLENLQKQLIDLSKKYKADISKVDIKNKRRVIRAIEIITELKHIPEINIENKYNSLIIGLYTDYEFLKDRIKTRIDKRLNQGMIKEVEDLLRENKINHERLQKLGLEYKFISDYLQGVLTIDEFKEKLYFAICHYAKRQKTWFKKSKNHVDWFDIQNKNYISEVFEKIKLFITPSSHNTTR